VSEANKQYNQKCSATTFTFTFTRDSMRFHTEVGTKKLSVSNVDFRWIMSYGFVICVQFF
jgi:hypothetical protein